MAITLSSAAYTEISRLGRKRGQQNIQFRLSVESGGCSGFVYGLDFQPSLQPNDHQVDCEGISIVIALEHLQYLEELTLDYTEDLMGGSFRFHNLNVVGVCNCGNSFLGKAER